MKSLLHGQRAGSPIQVLTLLTVLIVAVPLLALALYSRADAANARSETERTRATLYDLQLTVYKRCQVRSGYDSRQLNLDEALKAYYDDLLPNIRRNAPRNTFYRRLTGKVVLIRNQADALLSAGAPAGCEQYRPDPRLAPR